MRITLQEMTQFCVKFLLILMISFFGLLPQMAQAATSQGEVGTEGEIEFYQEPTKVPKEPGKVSKPGGGLRLPQTGSDVLWSVVIVGLSVIIVAIIIRQYRARKGSEQNQT